MATLATASDLSFALGETVPEDRFASIYRSAVRVITAGYQGDPETATGWQAEVVSGVLMGVMVRIASNPTGARQLNAGGAGLTFGGSDSDVSGIFSLTSTERADLEAASPYVLAAARRGAFTINTTG